MIRKYSFITLLMLLFTVVKGYTQPLTRLDTINRDPYIYPWFWNMINSYFYSHYELPESPDELISYIERIDMFMYNPAIDDEVKLITIPKIKKYIKDIHFTFKDSIFYVQIKDSIYMDTNFTNEPCDYIDR